MSAEAIIQKNDKQVKPKGLQDGGHVIIKCRKCNKALVDVWRTRPNLIDPRTNKLFEWKFVAQCCYCGDKSFVTTITGGIHLGGYGIDRSEVDSQEKTTVLGTTEGENGVTLVQTTKYDGG